MEFDPTMLLLDLYIIVDLYDWPRSTYTIVVSGEVNFDRIKDCDE